MVSFDSNVDDGFVLVVGGFRLFSVLAVILYLYSCINVHKNIHKLK